MDQISGAPQGLIYDIGLVQDEHSPTSQAPGVAQTKAESSKSTGGAKNDETNDRKLCMLSQATPSALKERYGLSESITEKMEWFRPRVLELWMKYIQKRHVSVIAAAAKAQMHSEQIKMNQWSVEGLQWGPLRKQEHAIVEGNRPEQMNE